MKYVIYLNTEEDEMRGQMFMNIDDYNAFSASIDPKCILYINGETIEANIPEAHKTLYPLVLRSFKKQWDGRQVIMAPPTPPMLPEAVEEPVVPVKKTRKPRAKKVVV